MGLYEQHLLPHVIDLGMNNRGIRRQRVEALKEVSGRVLEIGFGSGLNLDCYPAAVTHLVGVDPSTTAARIAKKRIEAAPFDVELIPLAGEALDLGGRRFDAVVSTFTLCSIDDVESALRNVRAALVPGGRFFFLEHGLAEEDGVVRWQRRLEPMQSFLFGGCRLTRQHDALIGAHFSIERVERYFMKGPRPMSFIYRGVATAT